MTRILLSILTSLVLSNLGFSQCYWAKSMGGGGTGMDISYSVKTDGSGNIYFSGTFQGTVDFNAGIGINNLTSVGQIDIFICKYDSSGNFIWAKNFGSTLNDYCKAIFVDNTGNVYATGYFQGTADFDPGISVFNLSSSGSTDIFITKLDANGNFVWAKKMGGTGLDSGYDITVDINGNILTTGTFSGTADFDPSISINNLISSGSQDIYISKYDNNCNYLWAKKIGGSFNDLGNSIITDSNCNVYTTGSFAGTADFDPGAGIFNISSAGSQSIFVNKLDSNGSNLWAKAMGGVGSGANQGNSIILDGPSNVLITGYFSSTIDIDPNMGVSNITSIGSQDIFICKINNNGSLIWAKNFGGTGLDMGNSVVVDNNSNIYSTGYFQNTVDFDPNAGQYNLSSSGVQDIYINKFDSNGNLIWIKNIGGTGDDQGNSIVLDPSSNLITTGHFTSNVDFNPDLGTYTLSSLGNVDVYIHKIIQSSPRPIITPSGNTSFCFGNSVTLSSSYPNGNLWSNGATTQSISSSSTGSFFVSTIDSICFSSSDSISVIVNPLPTTPIITTNGPINFCQGNSVTLTSSSASAYLWSTGATTQSINATAAGTYAVTVYNSPGCSATSASTSIVVNSVPVPTASNTGPYCTGSFISLSSSGGGTYSWSGPGGFTSSLQNPFRTNSTTAMSGNYTVTVTATNGCTATATTTVTVNQTPSVPTISFNSTTAFCQGDSVTLNSNYSFGNLWSTGATTQSIVARNNGWYWVTHNNGNCTSSRDSIQVRVYPNSSVPTITANGPLTFCQGDSVILSTNHPENALNFNRWYNGSTYIGFGQSITVRDSGTYYVRYEYTPSNQYYCPTNSSTLTVTILPRPTTPTITPSGALTICSGNSVTLSSSNTGAYLWSNGATTNSITVNSSGNYSLVTSNGACNSTSSNQVTVTVVLAPNAPTISASGPLSFCKGNMVTLTANQSLGLIWSNGETTRSVDIYDSGTYTLSVSNGICPSLASSPIVVTVNDPDVRISASGQLAENSPNTSITFTANVTNVGSNPTYQWYKNGLTVGSNSPTYTNSNWINGEKIVCRVTSSSSCAVYSNDLFVWLAQNTQDSWQRMADIGLDNNLTNINFPTRVGAISFAIGNKIYVGLGYYDPHGISTPNVGLLSDFWEYNTITDEWTERAPFAYGNSPRMNAVAFVVNGKGYVGFGQGNSGPYYNDLWEYNPQTDSWTQKSSCPAIGRHSAVATNVANSGYVGTGWSTNTYLNDWWKYTPSTDSWVQLASFPHSNFGYSCSTVNNKIYVTGSSTITQTSGTGINYEYNPETNLWTQKSSIPTYRYYSESFAIGDTIYVCGGQLNPANLQGGADPCNSAVTTLDEVWAYSPTTDSWIQKSDMNLGKISNGVTATVNGYGYYITGGYYQACQGFGVWNNGSYGREANLKYSPTTDSWEIKAVHGGIKQNFGFSTTIGNKGYALFQYRGIVNNSLSMADLFEIYMFEYDPSNNSWVQKSKYPGQGKFLSGIGFSINGKIYYGAGASGNNLYVSDFWEYDPSNDSWTTIGNVPIATSKGFSFVLNGKGYIGGGQLGTSFFEFNPSTFSWTSRQNIPGTPNNNISFAINGIGYTSIFNSASSGSLYKYDPSNNTWSLVGLLPSYSSSLSGAYFSFNTNTLGFYGTGVNSISSPSSSSNIYEFNPLTNNWRQVQSLPLNSNQGSTFSFPNSAYVFGGTQLFVNSVPINTLWQYKSALQITQITTAVKDEESCIIYPNPTFEQVNLIAPLSFIGKNCQIFDCTGKLIMNQQIYSENSVIRLSGLASGLYLLKIEGSSSGPYKIIKM